VRRAAIRRACEREGWRLIGLVSDHERRPVADRPGLRGALDRIGAGRAAGIVVADLDTAGGSQAGIAELMGAVRRAGGGTAVLAAGDATRDRGGRAALAAARERIVELRARGMAPRAIADTLNDEGIRTPGSDPLWRSWTVRRVAGAWPPRGPKALPRP
jgi:resolvase-like protein/recombinase